jgi:hypothetical protein
MTYTQLSLSEHEAQVYAEALIATPGVSAATYQEIGNSDRYGVGIKRHGDLMWTWLYTDSAVLAELSTEGN